MYLEIVSLSKPLLQSGANWPKHVTTGTLAIFQDEESWNSINRIHKRPKIMGDVKGSSWSSIKDTLNLNSEGKVNNGNNNKDWCLTTDL